MSFRLIKVALDGFDDVRPDLSEIIALCEDRGTERIGLETALRRLPHLEKDFTRLLTR